MRFLEYTNYSQATVGENFGAPEYSYWFVRKAFRHVLDRLGERVEISTPEREVDAIYREAQQSGDACVFLPFCPPNSTPLGQACPTLPVFAWEYDTLPDETWNDNPREDWRYVLKQTGMAITHCQSSVQAVRRSMGDDFPIWSIPAPIFDKHARASSGIKGWRQPYELAIEGGLAVSAGDIDLSLFRPEQPKADGVRALRVLESAAMDRSRRPQALQLEGVVYTSILNPYDGRKNWRDLVTGFIWAFRNTSTATLLLKITRFDVEDGLLPVLQHISTLGQFACKVVLIHGLLSEEAYAGLIGATSFAVNTAFGEGQCLPLMEYMSAGRPAVAPAHTAMLDYVTPDNSFVVKSDARLTHWPHDERLAKRCRHHLIRFDDLVSKYRESYRMARDEPDRYERMSDAAVTSLRAFCSDEVVTTRLAEVVRYVSALQANTRKAI